MWRPHRPRAQTAADHPGIALCRYVTVRTDIGGVSRTLTAAGTRALTRASAAQVVTVRSLPSWWSPSSSLPDDLGRVRRVKAKPADVSWTETVSGCRAS